MDLVMTNDGCRSTDNVMVRVMVLARVRVTVRVWWCWWCWWRSGSAGRGGCGSGGAGGAGGAGGRNGDDDGNGAGYYGSGGDGGDDDDDIGKRDDTRCHRHHCRHHSPSGNHQLVNTGRVNLGFDSCPYPPRHDQHRFESYVSSPLPPLASSSSSSSTNRLKAASDTRECEGWVSKFWLKE